jgi:hypothetical protein
MINTAGVPGGNLIATISAIGGGKAVHNWQNSPFKIQIVMLLSVPADTFFYGNAVQFICQLCFIK